MINTKKNTFKSENISTYFSPPSPLSFSLSHICHEFCLHFLLIILTGIWGSPRTCLHAILGILSRDLSPHRSPSTIVTSPQLAELAYELVYMLTADRDTSGPTMRYLRGTRDYFYRHLRHVPFNKHSESKFIYLASNRE